jgi:uncharacterized protein (DUF952 family)
MATNLTKTAMVNTVIKSKVYKVFAESEWKAFQKTGQFNGSADDLRDGFIHLSTKEQLTDVIERFFPDQRPLYIAEFSDPEFIQRLKWEASGSKQVYPHLYDFALLSSEISAFLKM